MKLLLSIFSLSLIASTSLVEAGKPINYDGSDEGAQIIKRRLEGRVAKIENQEIDQANAGVLKSCLTKQKLILTTLEQLKVTEKNLLGAAAIPEDNASAKISELEIPSVKATLESFPLNRERLITDLIENNTRYNELRNKLLSDRTMVKQKKIMGADGHVTYKVVKNSVPKQDEINIAALNMQVQTLQVQNEQFTSQIQAVNIVRAQEEASHNEKVAGLQLKIDALAKDNESLRQNFTQVAVMAKDPSEPVVLVHANDATPVTLEIPPQ